MECHIDVKLTSFSSLNNLVLFTVIKQLPSIKIIQRRKVERPKVTRQHFTIIGKKKKKFVEENDRV